MNSDKIRQLVSDWILIFLALSGLIWPALYYGRSEMLQKKMREAEKAVINAQTLLDAHKKNQNKIASTAYKIMIDQGLTQEARQFAKNIGAVIAPVSNNHQSTEGVR